MVNIQLLVTGTGAAMVVAGVVVCTWDRWRKPAPKKKASSNRRRARIAAGVALTLIGLYIALKKYVDESGWGQWIESMIDWLIPLLGTTLIVLGAAVCLWGFFADRSKGRRRCPRCWYDMDAVPGLVCPECGKDAIKSARLNRTQRHWRMVLLGLVMGGLGSLQFAQPWYERGGYLHWIPTRLLIYSIPSFDSNRSRLMWEFQRRMTTSRGVYSSVGRSTLPHLTPLTETSKAVLSRTAIATLENYPKHPMRELLYELMPDYLCAEDVTRTEPLVLAALSDPSPRVKLGAISTLRHVKAFDPKKSLDAVLAFVATAAVVSPGSDSDAFGEAAMFLGETGGRDPRVVPALISLLSPGTPRYIDYTVNNDVLWALSDIGPAAASASGAVRQIQDFTSNPLRQYTLMMIDSKSEGREAVLRKMLEAPEVITTRYSDRDFALEQMGEGPATPAIVTDLMRMLRHEHGRVRVAAADSLLSLGKETAAARAMLEQEVAEALLDVGNLWSPGGGPIGPLQSTTLSDSLDVYIRHDLDAAPIEARARTLYEKSGAAAVTGTGSPARLAAAIRQQYETLMRRIADYRSGRLTKDQTRNTSSGRRP